MICRKKRNALNNVVKWKARIVVRGSRKVEGEDFFDTFSPTVSPIADRTLIAASTALNYKLFHIDVTGAYRLCQDIY